MQFVAIRWRQPKRFPTVTLHQALTASSLKGIIMKTVHTFKATIALSLGIGCAVAAFGAVRHVAVDHAPQVQYAQTTTASGAVMSVVTVTAKRLTPAQKLVLAMRDKAGLSGKVASHGAAANTVNDRI
jgi:hypothetical protein